jgi:hypothetical protein
MILAVLGLLDVAGTLELHHLPVCPGWGGMDHITRLRIRITKTVVLILIFRTMTVTTLRMRKYPCTGFRRDYLLEFKRRGSKQPRPLT